MTERPASRLVRPGEMLAMHASFLHQGPQAFFWMFGGGAVRNERRGDVSIVHIRDGLEHHSAGSWGADSYEAIVDRYASAISGVVSFKAHEWAHRWDEDYTPMVPTPPSAIVFCIDSPGGVVSGLNETVATLQKMRQASDIPLVAFVNELAASAAYAIACACDEIVCPRSAIVGSIGVISTMISQAAKNAKDGFDVQLITSGARKSDGNPNVAISGDAIGAEADRVNKLAAQFFRLAAKSRGTTIEALRSLEAGIFLGRDAEARGLVDDVMSLDDAILALQMTNRQNGIDSVSKSVQVNVTTSGGAVATENRMSLKLSSKRVKLEASIAAEKDPKKLVAMAELLAAYKKVEKHVEHTKSEEDDGEEDPDEKPKPADDDDDDDDAKAEDDKKAEDDAAAAAADKAEAEGEDDAKKASAALSLLESVTGKKGSAALGAAMAKFARLDKIAAEVGKLTADANAKELADLRKRAGRYVPNRLAATLDLKGLRALVTEAEANGSPMVATSEGDLIRPKAASPGTEESLPANVIEMIDAACATAEVSDKKAFRATLVKAHLDASNPEHAKRMTDALNGAGRI